MGGKKRNGKRVCESRGKKSLFEIGCSNILGRVFKMVQIYWLGCSNIFFRVFKMTKILKINFFYMYF